MNKWTAIATAVALWGASYAWDRASTIHVMAPNGRCVETDPAATRALATEGAIGAAIYIASPKRWKGPAVVFYFVGTAGNHAAAAIHNQNIAPACK